MTQIFSKNPLLLIPTMLTTLTLYGCQSVPNAPIPAVSPTVTAPTPTLPNADLPQHFTINGKIGVKSPKQTGSAFYTWSQVQDNFAIGIEGILGVGRADIRYEGNLATIKSDSIRTENHTLTAQSPEALLQKVSGWNAPISQLPYWILGKYAPSDSNNQRDAQGRLSVAQNSDWTANFSYEGSNPKLPSKIIMKNADTQVTLVINHL